VTERPAVSGIAGKPVAIAKGDGRALIVGLNGRAKVYRPLPLRERAAAVAAGLAAYDRGEFFDAHEELEPAWMGTDVVAERSLLQGMIKVAAAYVHAGRGNPPGIVRNLVGARALLAEAMSEAMSEAKVEGAVIDVAGAAVSGVEIGRLIEAVDLRLEDLAAHPDGPTLGPPALSTIDVVRAPESAR
jgi:hypothetical protein